VRFFDSTGKIIYQQPIVKSKWAYAKRNDKKGKGYYAGDQLVNEPFDFSKKNRLALTDLHSILESVFFPMAVEKKKRFNLTNADYDFLHRYMSMYPHESKFPTYDSSYNDSNVKFILWGGQVQPPPGIRIFSKSGDAYGFLTDVAYVVDFENNIEFMLSATIHCNRDGIYNDDHYDYPVGLDFLQHLGTVIYDYERGRSKKKVDFTSLKFDY
jgi:hypothetical protein